MKKAKIKFKDIKAGDLLEVIVKEFGVKSVMTGIAFEREVMETGVSRETVWWSTSEGGMIVNTDEESEIWRIDVVEVKFEDIRKGDLIKVTAKRGSIEKTVQGRAGNFIASDAAWYDGWETVEGDLLLRRRQAETLAIEILEREGE